MQSFDQRTQLEGLAIVGYKYLSMSFAIRAWRHYSFPSSTGNCDFSSTWKRTSSFSSRDRHPRRTSNALLVEPLRFHHFSSVETPPGSLQCSTCKSESKWKELYIFIVASVKSAIFLWLIQRAKLKSKKLILAYSNTWALPGSLLRQKTK